MAKAKLFLCKKCGFKHADHACDELPLHTIRRQEYERSLANIGRALSEVNKNIRPKTDLQILTEQIKKETDALFGVKNWTPDRIDKNFAPLPKSRKAKSKKPKAKGQLLKSFLSKELDNKKGPSITPSKRDIVYERDGYKCLRCGTDEDLTLDHVIPISKRGSSHISNLQTLCFECNNEKADDIIDYRDKSTDLTEEEAVAYFQQCLDERRQEREKKKNGLPWADFKKQLFDDLEREKIAQLRFVKTEREDYNDRKPDVAELKMMTAK